MPKRPDDPNFIAPRYQPGGYGWAAWPNPESNSQYGFVVSNDLNGNQIGWPGQSALLNYASGHTDDNYFGAFLARWVGTTTEGSVSVYSDASSDTSGVTGIDTSVTPATLYVRGTFHYWDGADPTYRKLFIDTTHGSFDITVPGTDLDFEVEIPLTNLQARRLIGVEGYYAWTVFAGTSPSSGGSTPANGKYGIAIWKLGVIGVMEYGGPPGRPLDVTAVGGAGQATVSWSPPVSDGGNDITSYTVTSTPGGRTATAGPLASSAIVTGLTGGISYTFTVKATTLNGDSPASDPSNSVTPTAGSGGGTGTPTGMTASVDPYDDQIEDTPNMLTVYLGNGVDDETVTVTLGGDTLVAIDLDEYGQGTVDVPVPSLPADDYELVFTGSAGNLTTLDFSVLNGGLTVVQEDHDTLIVPSITPDPAQHWQFIDNTIGDSHRYTMSKNPATWTNPWRPQYLEHAATTAPDGNILAWQGGERAWRFQFTGVITTRAEYQALEFWANLRRRFWLIDHRNEARYVTFENFDARARTVPNNPWVHDYTVSVIHFLRTN